MENNLQIKKLPYWLKGGLMVLIISVIGLLISAVMDYFGYNYETNLLFLIIWISHPVTILGYLLIWGDNYSPAFLSNEIVNVILGWMILFLIGSIGGFIYGKIKNN